MTMHERSNPQQRENPEPEEGNGAWPWLVKALVAALMMFGVVYLWRASITAAPELGDGRMTAELQGPKPATGAAAVDGAALFASRCAACHQATGAGLPGVFPPLAGSEWVNGDIHTLSAAVLHGINGKLTVKGQTYNGAMPTFGPQISDAELAAVLTHVRKSWGNHAGPVSAEVVASVRQATASRTEPFKGDAELSQFTLKP